MNRIQRIANSAPVFGAIIRTIAGSLRFAFATTRWERRGFETLHAALDTGEPVVIICWHQRLMFAPVAWDQSRGKACTLRAVSHAGRVSGAVQERLGLHSVPMSEDQSNLNASRKVAKLVRAGYTLGITADGPEGPARIAKTAGIEWARLTGKPVFLFTFSSRRHWTWKTWDKLMFPLPFTRGALMYRQWDADVPRRMDDATLEALRAKLEADLNALTAEADALAGVT